MRLYDTARQAVVPFEPASEVKMYTCGITPYDATHLGHAATYLTYDVLQRRLRDLGHETRCVRNITDVDDDLLRKARELGVHYLDLAAAEIELAGEVGRELLLRDHLAGMADEYDYLLIDCPPSLGVLTLNALVAVNAVVIPLQPHFLALHGMGKLLETTALVAKRINPALKVTGIVLSLYEATTRLAQDVVNDLREYLERARGGNTPWAKARIFGTRIRRNIKLAECPSFGQSILQYAPTCHGAQDYLNLAREVLGEAAAPTVLSARVEVNDRGQVGVLALEPQIRDEVTVPG